MKIKDLSTNHNAWLNETTLGKQLAEAPKAMVNFGAEDLKNLEQIRDLPTLKAQALSLISKPSAKPMKPEKVEWFKNALDSMNSPMKVIKLMYDLMLSGEGNSVIGSRNSMNPNMYRQRFGEEGIAEGQDKFVVWYMIDDGQWDEHGTFNNEADASAYIEQLAAKGYDDDNFEVLTPGQHPDDNYAYTKDMGEAGTLDRYRDRIGTSGQSDRYRDRQERRHERDQEYDDASHQSRLNRLAADDQNYASWRQNQSDRDAHRTTRMQKDDDDWEKTFDMMRDRLNRYQWSSQRDVDPEQLAAISNIKYEPRKKNESSPAGMQQSWTNSSDAVHTPGKPMPQSLRKKMNPGKPSGVQAKTDDELLAYYAQRKAEKQQGVKEGMNDSPVAGAITRRILMQRTDLLSAYGPVAVTQAIDDVADFVGDVDEIGSSDVSGWVKQVEQSLASMGGKGVAEAGFPGAPDVEMPPMKPSGDLERDKLKQEYVDIHHEIKSLVDIPYRSDSSPEQKAQAKARIKQLNDRADQIKAILEPRQPPNEWQKKTYGYDDNWNRVGESVNEFRDEYNSFKGQP